MIAKNCRVEDLKMALKITNEQYDNNIIFSKIEEKDNHDICFKLTVVDKHGAGARVHPERRTPLTKACWHVHGDFFDNLLTEVNHDAKIKTSFYGAVQIYYDGGNVIGNWQHMEVQGGAHTYPLASLCECDRS